MATPIRVATWNIHQGVGLDGRYNLSRTAAVLREIDADLVALQEVDIGSGSRSGECQVDTLARFSGYHGLAGPTLKGGGAEFGNALLSRRPIHRIERLDLSVPGYEPRGALAGRTELAGVTWTAIVTHFGLKRREREEQAQRLLTWPVLRPAGPVVLAGDFNEWFPASPVAIRLALSFDAGEARRTFPSSWPAFPLDRIFVRRASIRKAVAHRTPLSREASDHLPLVADVVPAISLAEGTRG